MALPEGFNWFIIFVAVVVTCLVIMTNIYVLIHYQHPEDRNQAWFPKVITIFGLSLAVCSVLMYPLDVANKRACSSALSPTACTYTLPMYQLWLAVFITNLILVWALIPFTVFFYEADSDFTFFQRIKSAIFWTLGFLVVIGLIIGILYGLIGYVVYPTQELQSGTRPIALLSDVKNFNYTCIPKLKIGDFLPASDPQLCDAFGPTFTIVNWKLRVTLPIYIIAVQSVIGWCLFLIFAGVGVLSAPIDWLQQFVGRPKSTITKSEYMRRARIIAQRAKEVTAMLAMLRRQDRDRRWRSNFKKMEREVNTLEEDEYQLERVFPQGEDGDARWVLFVLGYYVMGFMGVVGILVSLAWIVHICLYMLPPVPVHPLLNDLFVTLDGAFALLGVAFFGAFCLYLMVIAIKGNFLLGLNFLVVKLYPMRPGATMMNSFLVNTAIILTMAPAIIQFCAQAFAVYGDSTDIFDIFGNQVLYLMGLSYLYNFNIFLYMFLAVMVISSCIMCFKGSKQFERKRKGSEYEVYAQD